MTWQAWSLLSGLLATAGVGEYYKWQRDELKKWVDEIVEALGYDQEGRDLD